ncbi:pseudouridine-5'-phosphate glycosidase [uncultured Paludibaculum sp.]|uniref:pseudouridine-5'-phosphate glycosidase n=1 Tax=uncultured Paludibaculum sp. TaxID=1765020 RepID=UPI00374CF96B
MKSDQLWIAPRVRESKQPVVALESTIIAHGMPYPVNVETALAVERIVAAQGATPATLGILDGRIIVGLSTDEIERIATAGGVLKACERDIPIAVAHGANAATTAGASLAIAAAAGIAVFVTGGIGAVGPQASTDFDVSADLPAIAEYPVITVCAGAKAFMDIGATLEWLETHRVPVATWGSDEFPLFYSRRSGFSSGWRVESAAEVAAVHQAKRRLGLDGGLLVAVPLPEEQALPEEMTHSAIRESLRQAGEAGISGKALTPFLLSRIKELTGGRSLESNIALIRNNARVGGQIAAALAY